MSHPGFEMALFPLADRLSDAQRRFHTAEISAKDLDQVHAEVIEAACDHPLLEAANREFILGNMVLVPRMSALAPVAWDIMACARRCMLK